MGRADRPGVQLSPYLRPALVCCPAALALRDLGRKGQVRPSSRIHHAPSAVGWVASVDAAGTRERGSDMGVGITIVYKGEEIRSADVVMERALQSPSERQGEGVRGEGRATVSRRCTGPLTQSLASSGMARMACRTPRSPRTSSAPPCDRCGRKQASASSPQRALEKEGDLTRMALKGWLREKPSMTGAAKRGEPSTSRRKVAKRDDDRGRRLTLAHARLCERAAAKDLDGVGRDLALAARAEHLEERNLAGQVLALLLVRHLGHLERHVLWESQRCRRRCVSWRADRNSVCKRRGGSD
jgi:hypothetical protein